MSNATRPSKNERRDAAREKAREERLRQQRREKRNKLVLQLSIGLVILAIVAVVSVIIVNSVRPPGPGPRNMANGGITLSGTELAAVETPAAPAEAVPAPEPAPDGKVLIQAWEDFGCPSCQQFEQINGERIQQLVESGAADVQYFPVAILDNAFPDRYSTRAANAAAAVASFSPDTFSAFHARLYDPAVQPAENTAGLSDDRLIQIARRAGATNMPQIERAIRDGQFENWIAARTEEFTTDAGALRDVDFSGRLLQDGSPTGPGTPTVLVNGQYYDGRTDFGAFVTQIGGGVESSATPEPTGSPLPQDGE